ncbi:ead/Ea22-like family protein, partial [Escherichia coli]|nr:ead/Ea22-like family protein [Escherichia coli]
REAAERATPAMERLLMLPVDDDLISEQELKDSGVDIDALNAFKFLAGPETVLALLDERERNQQYIKRRDQENEDIALTVGKLRVELEAAEKRIAELEAEPVSNSDELPLDYLQGHKDGLEWAAQLAEANHPQTGDWLYDDPIDLARAIRKGPDMPTVQAGNYPVIPDSWISCSERMPNDAQWCVVDAEDGYYVQCWSEGQGWLGDDISLRNCDVIRWMPIPEPPQQDGE